MLWALLGQAVFFIFQFGSTIIISRLLSPREVGIFAIALATTGVVTAIQSLGLGNYIIKAKNPTRSDLSTVFSVNFLICLALAIFIAMLAYVGGAMFADPGVRRVLLWLAWTPLIGSLSLVPIAMLQRDGNFRAVSLLKIVSTAVGTVATVSLAFVGFSFMSLAYGQVIAAAFNSLIVLIIAPHYARHRLGLANWRAVAMFGAQMLSINGVTQVQRQMQSVALGKLLGLSSLGLFSRAGNLYNIVYDNIYAVIARVLLVDLVNIHRTGEPLRDRYRIILECLTVLLWPAFAGLAVLAGPFVELVYGHKWVGAALPLSILCINGILWVAIALTWELFVVANQVGIQARIEFIRATIGLTFFIAGACFSLAGAATGLVLEGVLAILLYRAHILRITQCEPGDFWPIFLRSGLLTLLGVGPTAITMAWLGWPLDPPLLLIAIAIATGFALWVLAIAVSGHPFGKEVKTLLRKRIVRSVAAGKPSPSTYPAIAPDVPL
ncbi:MAG: polysaccharide biosynthesis protein [Pseudomonas sp.]|nr:MAG: polysaccharide biosynthesis protein [Pseudomonas sp.]